MRLPIRPNPPRGPAPVAALGAALVLSATVVFAPTSTWSAALTVASPNGRIVVAFRLDAVGAPSYRVERDGSEVLGAALG